MTDKEKTFCDWVNNYSDILYRFAQQRIRDEEICKDLIQETFLSAWRNLDHYQGKASVKNWLFVILKNKITDHYRKSHSSEIIETISREYHDQTYFDDQEHWKKGMYPKQWTVDLDHVVESKEFMQVFRSCGKKLKEIQNTVFVLKYVEGMDSEEICRELSISSSNYWVLIHRAKVQLRACLEKNWMSK